MTNFSSHLKNTIYFVLASYLIGLIALILVYSQISNLNLTTTTKTSEQCTEESSVGESGVYSCQVYSIKPDVRPYVIPLLIYLAIIIFGLIHINRELKKIVNDFEQFNAKSQQAITKMEPTQTNFRFIELNQVLSILNQNIIELNNNEENRHNYVSYVMHDIKTPLQVIRGYIDILKSGIAKENYYTVIEEQVEHINNIAQTTSYIAGYTPNKEFIEMDKLIEKLKSDYKTIDPTIKFETSIEQVVWEVDYDGLLRCLHNLINNSIQAGSKVIKLRLQPAKLELIDEGSGFSQQQYIEYLNYSSKTQGHFGLKIVDTIIKANDLHIKYSKQSNGTKVTITNDRFR